MKNIVDLLKTLHPTLTSHKLLQTFIIHPWALPYCQIRNGLLFYLNSQKDYITKEWLHNPTFDFYNVYYIKIIMWSVMCLNN
jgi:hypothetical protein